MIYLHKILPLFFSPLSLIIFILILGIYLKSNKINLIGLFLLILFSLPVLATSLTSYLEGDYIPKKITKVNSADAIVVLGGITKIIKSQNGFKHEFNDGVDRILAGIDLFKNNKAPLLIFTRGRFPWSIGKPEGEYLKDTAIKFGVPKQNILLTSVVQNTDQEAKAIKKLLTNSDNSIILVTSAFHMTRAKKIFEALGFKISPFPVDFLNQTQKLTIKDFIPSAYAFKQTNKFFREIIGRAYYSLKY